MNRSTPSPTAAMLLSLLIGAAAGALLVALNTNKPDLERERQAKARARNAKRGAQAVAEDLEGLLDDWNAPSVRAAGDLKRSMTVSIQDLPG